MKSVFSCLITVLFFLMSCGRDESTPIGAIYSSDEFSVYTDRVEQGEVSISVAMRNEEKQQSPQLPVYYSDQPIIDALFSLAIREICDSIPRGNIVYPAYLSLAALTPDEVLAALKTQVKATTDGMIIMQSAGMGGSWPVTTNRISWAMAMWEIYKVTGDKSILSEALKTIDNTLNIDMRTSWDDRHKLMRGAFTLPDKIDEQYPLWMDAVDIYESMSLGANVMSAYAFKVRDMILSELSDNEFEPMWVGIDREISNSVNTRLWRPNAGVYGQYLYGGVYPILSTVNDNFAQALAVIFDIANPEMAKSIISRTPYTDFGISPLFPLYKSQQDANGNSGGTSALTQAFWNIASAKARNMKAVEKGIGAALRSAAFYAAGKDRAFVVSTQNGRYIPEEAPGKWNNAGMASLVLRVIMGMEYTPDGITFNPIVPSSLPGEKSLSGLKYRQANLSVKIYGTGERIKNFSINSIPQKDHFLPDTLHGNVTVEITMDNRPAKDSKIENRQYEWMPAVPEIRWTTPYNGDIINHTDSMVYHTFLNSSLIETVKTDSIEFTVPQQYCLMDVVPINKNGTAGYSSKPHEYIPEGSIKIIPASKISKTGTALISNHKLARRFVETTTQYNTVLYFNVTVENGGDYLFDVSYCNGSGPENAGDKCALRMLYIDGAEAGAIVMPQQGDGKWSSPQFSNMIHIKLRPGTNHLSLRQTLNNMNGETNTALIQYARIIAL